MKRVFLLLVLLGLSACEPPPDALRLVSVEIPASAGLSLRELPPAALKSLGLPYGLAVVKAAGLAELAGLRIGDVVYGVNQQRIGNFEDFTRLLTERSNDRLGLLVRRGTADLYLALDLSGGRRRPRDTLLRT